jgi:hypothetical protein
MTCVNHKPKTALYQDRGKDPDRTASIALPNVYDSTIPGRLLASMGIAWEDFLSLSLIEERNCYTCPSARSLYTPELPYY